MVAQVHLDSKELQDSLVLLVHQAHLVASEALACLD